MNFTFLEPNSAIMENVNKTMNLIFVTLILKLKQTTLTIHYVLDLNIIQCTVIYI